MSLLFIILCNPTVRKIRTLLSPFYHVGKFKLIIRLYKIRYRLFFFCLSLVMAQHFHYPVNFTQVKSAITCLKDNFISELDNLSTKSSAEKTSNVSLTAETPATLFSENGLIFPQSQTAYLTDSDITELKDRITDHSPYDLKTLLSFARNEIYARHGQPFKTPALSKHYSQFKWYSSQHLHNVQWSEFNDYETFNIQFIQNYENSEV